MENGAELVEIVNPHSRVKSKMSIASYAKVKEFIIDALRLEGCLTLNQLLEIAERQRQLLFGESTSWYILKVKQDMEARGEIKVMKGTIANPVPVFTLRKRRPRFSTARK